MKRDFQTYNEILSQPEAWEDALRVFEQNRLLLKRLLGTWYDQVLFIGCGSTYYLSLSIAALFQQITGKIARAVPSGELLLNERTVLTAAKTLLVAISRSGSTTETICVAERFKRRGYGPVVGITNYGESPLAGLADVALVIEKGQEQSVVQTRSLTSMGVAATALSLLAGGQEDEIKSMYRLPEVADHLIANYHDLARQFGENLHLDRYYFLGSGIRYGLACEASLKMKEMALSQSEAFHFLEFRHGPMCMVSDTTVVVGLFSASNISYERAVTEEMRARGALIFSLAETDGDVVFQSGIPENAQGMLYLPILHLLAFYQALKKGLNPDSPQHLRPVVTLQIPCYEF